MKGPSIQTDNTVKLYNITTEYKTGEELEETSYSEFSLCQQCSIKCMFKMIKYSIKAIKITLNKVTGKYQVNSKEFMKKKIVMKTMPKNNEVHKIARANWDESNVYLSLIRQKGFKK